MKLKKVNQFEFIILFIYYFRYKYFYDIKNTNMLSYKQDNKKGQRYFPKTWCYSMRLHTKEYINNLFLIILTHLLFFLLKYNIWGKGLEIEVSNKVWFWLIATKMNALTECFLFWDTGVEVILKLLFSKFFVTSSFSFLIDL